jgi:hypothetical protein
MSSTGANRESEGGTMKNVIDNQETEPQSHTYAEDQSNSDTQGTNNKSSFNGTTQKTSESDWDNCRKN